MKKAGVIASVVIILLVLLFLGLRNLSRKADASVESNVSYTPQDAIASSDKKLSKVVNEGILSFDSDIISTTGTISMKSLYLDGTQLICYIEVTLDDIEGTKVGYFCSYGVFKSLSNGLRVSVDYQRVSDSVFSVFSLSLLSD